MKKKLLMLLAIALPLVCAKSNAQAVITFEKSTVELGTFNENQPQNCVFEFTNTGDKPLVIHQAFASCGCTKPEYTPEPIAPGQKGQIRVTYDGKGKPLGEFTKPISVRSNASNSLVRIYIHGKMKKQ
ncbi:MAG: DUF1573 domain-containing protein [Alloprevotella sp.]|nr:DUF1573 domain-containing protein [Alloprevotella sp.]MBR1652772.1 DUF1573 domain-containing protein [Alloprevotella sp.]